MIVNKIKDMGRMSQFAIVGMIILAVVTLFHPAHVAVLGWTAGKVLIAATLGYWVDRIAFPEHRPHEVKPVARADAARLRRAIIISAVVLAMAVAV